MGLFLCRLLLTASKEDRVFSPACKDRVGLVVTSNGNEGLVVTPGLNGGHLSAQICLPVQSCAPGGPATGSHTSR